MQWELDGTGKNKYHWRFLQTYDQLCDGHGIEFVVLDLSKYLSDHLLQVH
jgi:hypothetical protein